MWQNTGLLSGQRNIFFIHWGYIRTINVIQSLYTIHAFGKYFSSAASFFALLILWKLINRPLCEQTGNCVPVYLFVWKRWNVRSKFYSVEGEHCYYVACTAQLPVCENLTLLNPSSVVCVASSSCATWLSWTCGTSRSSTMRRWWRWWENATTSAPSTSASTGASTTGMSEMVHLQKQV